MRQRVDREYAKMCVGNGWHGLVDELFDILESRNIEATQIKEKFGQLRVYTYPADEEVYDLIEEIEKRSATICETCGAESKIQNRGGWLRSICNPCLEKLNVHTKA